MHLWSQCGVLSPLLPYNLSSQFCLFPLKYVIPSLFFILYHFTWSLSVMVTFPHCSPCLIISFYFLVCSQQSYFYTPLYVLLLFYHEYFSSCHLGKYHLLFCYCQHVALTIAELKIRFYKFTQRYFFHFSRKVPVLQHNLCTNRMQVSLHKCCKYKNKMYFP